jgi:hypothetical protein
MKRRLITAAAVLALMLSAGSPVAEARGNGERFVAHLDATDAGTASPAQGQAVFRLSKDGTRLHFKLIVASLENVMMAHIHLAPPGENGPPVVWLYPSRPPMLMIGGETNGILSQGTITENDLVGPLMGGTLDDLLAEMMMGRTYVNVHTVENPAGEIRGQIR